MGSLFFHGTPRVQAEPFNGENCICSAHNRPIALAYSSSCRQPKHSPPTLSSSSIVLLKAEHCRKGECGLERGDEGGVRIEVDDFPGEFSMWHWGHGLGFVLAFQFLGADPAAFSIGTGARQSPFNLTDLGPPEADDDTTAAGRAMLRQQRRCIRG